jgi:beta-glucosidase
LKWAANSVNGEWAGQNRHLLWEILREQWGFQGFVMTDFIWGMRNSAKSLAAGQDIEAPFAQQRARDLRAELADGRASWADVDRSARAILSTQLRFFAGLDDEVPPLDVVACAEHTALAREVAERSMVLLKNDPAGAAALLPLDAGALRKLAVVGKLADVANTGDHGSSDVRAPYVVSPLEGIRAALPGVEVVHAGDQAQACQLAAGADAAVVVVGYTAADEGEYLGGEIFDRPELWELFPAPADAAEQQTADALHAVSQSSGNILASDSAEGDRDAVGAGGDRASVRLLPADVELIKAVAAVNPRTVVVIVAAGAVIIEEWKNDVPAILISWYSGMEGGHALASVLLGRANPAGRLPFSVPTSEAHLPPFDRDATAITYDKWFGQRLIDKLGMKAAYPLGYGLSYTEWSISAASAVRDGDQVRVTATVRNTGRRDGHHVVQVYGKDAEGSRQLLGFTTVAVAAQHSAQVSLIADLTRVGTWDASRRSIIAPGHPVNLEVSGYAGDPAACLLQA